MGISYEPELGGEDSESLTEQLISLQSTSTFATDEDSEEPAITKFNFPFIQAAATALLVIGGLVASASAMISVGGWLVVVAGLVCIVNSPWVAVNQMRIYKYGGLKQVINQLRDQGKLLRETVRMLEGGLRNLTHEYECWHEIQQDLDDLAQKQDWNSDDIVAIVKENESILEKMKDCLREVALVEIAQVVFRSDRNGDTTVNLEELSELTLRLQLALDLCGINLDESKFKAMVIKDNRISHLMKAIGVIMFEDKELFDHTEIPDEEMRPASLKTPSTERRFQQLADDSQSKTIAEIPMFSLQERFTKGSVAVARGFCVVSLSREPTGPIESTEDYRRMTAVQMRESGYRASF